MTQQCCSRAASHALMPYPDAPVEHARKGALAEQYVCQELKRQAELHIHYYTNDNSTSEVEFIVDNGTAIVPVEVKSGVNVRARSLMAYISRFQPDLAIRLSLKGYEEQNGKNLISLPLYAVGNVSRIIRRKNSQIGASPPLFNS